MTITGEPGALSYTNEIRIEENKRGIKIPLCFLTMSQALLLHLYHSVDTRLDTVIAVSKNTDVLYYKYPVYNEEQYDIQNSSCCFLTHLTSKIPCNKCDRRLSMCPLFYINTNGTIKIIIG